jgi:hypothetical protein
VWDERMARWCSQETVGVALVMKHNTSRLDQRDLQAYLEPLLQKAKWPQVNASAGFPGLSPATG